MSEKLDMLDNSHSGRALAEMKLIEKKRKDCQTVKILNGYVMTNNPGKWEMYNRNIK